MIAVNRVKPGKPMKKKSGDFFAALKSIILPESTDQRAANGPVTNNFILKELMECFENSCKRESVGKSLLFNMHYLIILHPEVYEERLPSLPVIVKEALKAFYGKLKTARKNYDELSPVSFHWHFRFAPGTDFNQERISVEDVRVIGMLTGLKPAGSGGSDRHNTARVTMKSKATNVFDKMDINLDVLRHLHFAENGTFTVKFNPDLSVTNVAVTNNATQRTARNDAGLARIEYYTADTSKDAVYIMKDTEIVIARKEPENVGYSNYLLIESGFVSNPHARIRWNESQQSFQIASFSNNETRVNETVIGKSEAGSPRWFDLRDKSQVLLNGMVTLTFKQL
ncbi:hypothetical protein A3860_17240 [Niastella vici]|uniref:FHA domain-containing protein n=2 Tax=Niastella vici TaxID=1703345 RepID=A0A1V9G437_9BACT|nr:hypothetical protein A3860_17240 [Niastella vici]